jgi:hypothetical protein
MNQPFLKVSHTVLNLDAFGGMQGTVEEVAAIKKCLRKKLKDIVAIRARLKQAAKACGKRE